MIQIKKTLLTLVALLAVTTGAWAEETLLLTIESKDNTTFTSGSETFDDMVTVTFSNSVYNQGNNNGWFCGSKASLLTVAGINGYTITSCKFYTENYIAANGYTVEGESPSVYIYNTNVYTDASQLVNIGYSGVTKIEVYGTAPSASSATAVDIDWNAATKTGTFTQPAGNVTVSVEYYDLATLASQGLTAAEDAAAKTEAPLAVVADGAVTGGTLMYYVATDANFTQADAIALAETEWSAAIPTAEKLNPAGGTYYVWYYIKGDAEHSDTDPQPLTVTVLPEPTYTVEFAEGTPESDKWKAEPATDVKKGQTVTVTYTGTRKVIGVKAEKKAKAPASTPLDNTTTAWTAGTFAVPAGGLTYSDAITVSGDVTLVLTDGETLTLNKGISLASGATLTIQGNGTMNVNGTSGSTASTVDGSGTIILTSGTLTAKGGNGGGYGDREAVSGSKQAGGVAINGAVTVSGGTLTATGGAGGSIGDSNANVTAGAGGAAISGSVTLVSGTLTATGGNGGNGGDHSDGTAGAGGAAIGGDLTVNGGTMTTTNGSNGSQIGMTAVNLGAGGKAVAGTVTDNR